MMMTNLLPDEVEWYLCHSTLVWYETISSEQNLTVFFQRQFSSYLEGAPSDKSPFCFTISLLLLLLLSRFSRVRLCATP